MGNCFSLHNGWLFLAVLALAACSSTVPPSNVKANARLTPSTDITRALTRLPEPKVKIPVAVYGLRDQTGQYKASPESPYSTAVTQGAATVLVKALRDSGWYIPVEREGVQDILTERRIVRAIESPTDKGKPSINLPNLLPASLIIEGGITAYDSNVRTGGKGANFLGIGGSTQYRVDQVTVDLRSIDIRNGQVLNAVSVTKTIYSYQFDASVYKFTSYQHLLQGETGYTTNEPAELAVREAIEAAVVHLTVQGVRERILELKNEQDWGSTVIQAYLKENVTNLTDEEVINEAPVPMLPLNADNPPPVVRPLTIPADTSSVKPGSDVSGAVATPRVATVQVIPENQSLPLAPKQQQTPSAGANAIPEPATMPPPPANPSTSILEPAPILSPVPSTGITVASSQALPTSLVNKPSAQLPTALPQGAPPQDASMGKPGTGLTATVKNSL
jgi:curli production assembly/transport component CsgG